MQSTLKTITIVLFLMSSWTALNAQSTETKEKRTASQKALDCENCQKDRVEYLSIIAEKVVKIEAQQAKIDNYDGAIEAIKIRMEEMNLKQKDLVGVIGGKSRVSEVLNKKKKLTVDMIRELEHLLHISASVLVSNYQLLK